MAPPATCSGIVCERPSFGSGCSFCGLLGADADFSGCRVAATVAAEAGAAGGAWEGGAATGATKAGIVISEPAKVGGLELPGVITRVPSLSTFRVRPDSGSMYAADTLTSEELMSRAPVHE